MKKTLLVLMALMSLAACKPEQEAAPAAMTPVKKWVGRWVGPEGTSLAITKTKAGYQVTIRDLDRPRRFEANEKDGKLYFIRDGAEESIHEGTGADTGMKWLAEKPHCLIVKVGEGYCRP